MKYLTMTLMALVAALVLVATPADCSQFGGTNSTLKSTAVMADMAFEGGTAGTVLCRSAYFAPQSVSPAANSVIEMVPIPKGAMVLDVVVRVPAGFTGTVDVGDGDDVDRFYDGLSPATNATFPDNAAGAGSWNYVYATDDTIDVKVLSAAYGATNATYMDVYYKMVDGFILDEADAFD